MSVPVKVDETVGEQSSCTVSGAPRRLTIVSRPLAVVSPKALLRKVVETVTGRERYAVHRALMQYTLTGLRRIGHRPIYDPVSRYQCSRHALIMGCDENLSWAIRARRNGRLKFLALGPLMAYAVREQLLRFVPLQAHIDRIFVPSDYYRMRCCDEAPELAHLFTAWSCGVDTDYWAPGHREGGRPRVVVYQKNAPNETLDRVLETLSRLPVDPLVLKYGTYGPPLFRQALQGASCAVFLSRVESQGIAMAEAWACDVPTFIWRDSPNTKKPYSAPLLSQYTGAFFHASAELRDQIDGVLNGEKYAPREWVLQHLTAEGQAAQLLKLCNLKA